MRFKYSLQMVFANFKQTYKLLLYKLIFILLIFGGCYGVLYSFFGDILTRMGFFDLINKGFLVIKNIFVNTEELQAASEAFKNATLQFSAYFTTNISRLAWIIVIIVAFTFLYRFFAGMAEYALGEVINDHMSSLTHRGFLMSLFKNVRISLTSQLFTAMFFTAINVLECAFVGIILYFTYDIIGFFSVFVSLVVVLMLNSLARVFISGFLPALIVGGNKYAVALKRSFSCRYTEFSSLFSTYLVTGILNIFLFVSVALFTLGVGLLILVPVMSLFHVSVQFVNYYMVEKKKFYITYDNIVVPKELRDEEKLLNKMDI